MRYSWKMYEIPSTYSYSPPYAPSSNSPPSSAHSYTWKTSISKWESKVLFSWQWGSCLNIYYQTCHLEDFILFNTLTYVVIIIPTPQSFTRFPYFNRSIWEKLNPTNQFQFNSQFEEIQTGNSSHTFEIRSRTSRSMGPMRFKPQLVKVRNQQHHQKQQFKESTSTTNFIWSWVPPAAP